MCAIVGWVDFHSSPQESQKITLLKKMHAAQKHRGPDEEGFFFHPNLILGHQRLAIWDPEGGEQPLTRVWQGRNYTLIYNGELYNAPELQEKWLQGRYPISTHSDTEILLWMYIHHRDSFLSLLEGMFSFALWDEDESLLWLVRDPLGIKPLFWAPVDQGWIFGSEVKSLLQHPQISRHLDIDALNELWMLYPSRSPGKSPFPSIHELKPGHALHISPRGLKNFPYFQWKAQPHTENLPETLEIISDRMLKVISQQLQADVPLGSMLSGGIDSSFLCAVAQDWHQKKYQTPLRTYSVDFSEQEAYFQATQTQPDTDTLWIQTMVDALHSHHHQTILTPKDLQDHLEEATLARDMPGMADVDASLLLFSQAMQAQNTKAVLSGEGADEAFGGYPWFNIAYKSLANRPSWDPQYTAPWISQYSERIYFLRQEWIDQLKLKEYFHEYCQQIDLEVPTLPGESPEKKKIRTVTYATYTRWLPVLLERKDRMTMAASIEARVPFCDAQLLQYLANVPWEWKNQQGVSKSLLRTLSKNWLPESIRTRPKNPYPRSHHPKFHEAMQEKVAQLMQDPSSPLHESLDPDKVNPWLQKKSSSHLAWFGQVMQASSLLAHWIQLDFWWKQYHIFVRK